MFMFIFISFVCFSVLNLIVDDYYHQACLSLCTILLFFVHISFLFQRIADIVGLMAICLSKSTLFIILV